MPTKRAATPVKATKARKKPSGRPNPANNPHYAERAARAVELRKAGATYDDIARALGIKSKGAACEIVQNALRRSIAEPAAELVEMETMRLDRLWLEAYRIATAPGDDPELKLKAIDRCVRISERRSKLLGLDADDQMEERRLALAEQQQQMLVGIFSAVFADLELTPEQRRLAPTLVRRQIEAVAASSVQVA